MSAPRQPGELEEIPAEECLELLRSVPWARVGFVAHDVPSILPVTILLHEGCVYFRTAPGSKLGSAAGGNVVAIQADGGDPDTRLGWSVLVHGHASIVTDGELEARLLALPLDSWTPPDDKAFWVGVTIDRVSGRRIAPA